MHIKRLELLITHLRTIASFPDYKGLIESQASTVTYVPKRNIQVIKDIRPNARTFKRKGSVRHD